MNHIVLSARQLEPHLLQVKDVTPLPQAGYLSGLSYYELSITQANLTAPLIVARTTTARDGDWFINTHDYSRSQLLSGVYVLRLEALGFPPHKRRLGNFFLRLSNLELKDRVWVRMNGGFVDMTPAGIIEDGDWVWQALDTYDSYDQVEVRHGDGRLPRQEQVIPQLIREDSYLNVKDPVVLAAGSAEIVCCRTERIVWAQLVHRLVQAWQGRLTDARAEAWVPADEEQRLNSISAGLTLLEGNHIKDGVLASQQLRLVQSQLSQCKR